VAEAGGTPEMVAAALLHDTVEDSDATEATIAAAFGPCIATLVAGLTDVAEWKTLPRAERKRRQAAHMARAPRAVRRIKIADQTSNVRDVGRLPKGWEPAEARAYVAEAALVVDACRGADAGLEAAFDAARTQALATLDAIEKGGQ
jgi:guanosine-3',5'-bis(diphosphate) 3'-pyrophosphohydrolase